MAGVIASGPRCTDLAPSDSRAPPHKMPNPEHHQRADDAADDARRLKVGGTRGVIVHQHVDEEAADERTNDTQYDGRYPTHRVLARHDGPGDESCDQTDDNHPDDAHGVALQLERE